MQRRRYGAVSITSLVASLVVACNLPALADDNSDTSTLRPAAPTAVAATTAGTGDLPEKIRKSWRVAYMMARYEWLDQVAAANPRVLEAICSRPGPAKRLAKHKHLDKLADADHYLCRRITRWKSATNQLVLNPKADHVITLDPQGIYYAIDRDPHIATMLARHRSFDNMAVQNPDLVRQIDQHVR